MTIEIILIKISPYTYFTNSTFESTCKYQMFNRRVNRRGWAAEIVAQPVEPRYRAPPRRFSFTDGFSTLLSYPPANHAGSRGGVLGAAAGEPPARRPIRNPLLTRPLLSIIVVRPFH